MGEEGEEAALRGAVRLLDGGFVGGIVDGLGGGG